MEQGKKASSRWPLALCDLSSMNPSTDLVPADVIAKGVVNEQAHVYHREESDWYYLGDQVPGEMLMFVQSDTQRGWLSGEE